ncbi:MAG: DUF116 domain-containing protein [Candidatus Fermentibacteraceae bacterium]
MSEPRLPRSFCIAVKVRYLFMKLLEALKLAPPEAAELAVVASVNRKTLAMKTRFSPDRVLLLLPHCLQFHECPHRITFDIDNCVRCGGCVVGALSKTAGELGIEARVTTGGTLARRLLREKNPGLVVAVACPRDLGQGILDALPLPALGVLNARPNGDCFDTTVSMETVRGLFGLVLKQVSAQ